MNARPPFPAAPTTMTDRPTEIDLLLVDDEADFRETAADYFTRRGYRVTTAGDGEKAIEAIQRRRVDVAVLDVMMPGMTGLELLRRLREEDPHLRIIMLTGGATVPSAVEAMKLGAVDYVTKPIRLPDLDGLIQRAYQSSRLARENEQLRQVIRRQTANVPRIVGSSREMTDMLRLVDRVAGSDKPVLIEGESGTGKELIARAIHAASPLADRPMVVINCAALPETLLESELFGHERGAFTGAVAAKPGLFEIADGGTLLIDEFGELAGPLQAKLLRVLEDGSIRRIGSIKERRVRVRIIAATNRDLSTEVAAGRFREDLFYRVNVLSLRMPPLRARPGDLPELIDFLLGKDWTLEPGTMELFQAYRWPGNVRQLINAIERAKILADDHVIRRQNLPPEIGGGAATATRSAPTSSAPTSSAPTSSAPTSSATTLNAGPTAGSLTAAATAVAGSSNTEPDSELLDLETLSRTHVLETLRKLSGNKARAARALGIGRRSLYRLLEKYGQHVPHESNDPS
jgi:DNA-binding NtrC family response regulator